MYNLRELRAAAPIEITSKRINSLLDKDDFWYNQAGQRIYRSTALKKIERLAGKFEDYKAKCQEVLKMYGIISKTQSKPDVYVYFGIAYHLLSLGYTYTEIARIIRKDRSTVLYYDEIKESVMSDRIPKLIIDDVIANCKRLI